MSIMCLAFLVVFTSLSFSLSSNNEIIMNDSDSLSSKQSDIVNDLSHLQKSKTSNNSRIVEEISKSYLLLTKAFIRDRENYNPDVLLDSRYIDSPKLKFRSKLNEYYSRMLELDNRVIIWDKIKYRVEDTIIINETAYVRIVEDYTYFVNDKFNKISRRIQEYYIHLKKNNDEWKITEVTSNTPLEDSEGFEYYDFDVNEAIKIKIKEREQKTNLPPEVIEINPSIVTTLANNYWTYSSSLAIAYAEDWYDGVNQQFGAATQDCQNFASQVVWAGLGGEVGTGAPHLTTYPTIYSSTYGSTLPRLWQHNNYTSTEYLDATKGYGWHWDNVNGFFHLINSSSSTNMGPYGRLYYNLNYASTGDVIAYNTGSETPALGNLDHAMVVTSVTGTSGSRNPSDIFIAAHNGQTSSAFQALDDYTLYSETHFATARIYGGYYPADPY